MNNMNQFAKEVADREGLKQGVSIAQIKEIIRIIAHMVVLDPKALILLLKNGLRD